MIGLLRAEPDTGPIGQPETPTWRLALRHFESFRRPDPLHAFDDSAPTVVVQQGGESADTHSAHIGLPAG